MLQIIASIILGVNWRNSGIIECVLSGICVIVAAKTLKLSDAFPSIPDNALWSTYWLFLHYFAYDNTVRITLIY